MQGQEGLGGGLVLGIRQGLATRTGCWLLDGWCDGVDNGQGVWFRGLVGNNFLARISK